MKIQFIKTYQDGKRTYQPGWVGEVSDPDGERLVSQGFAKEVDKSIRSRKYAPEAKPATECVVPERIAEKSTTVERQEAVDPPPLPEPELAETTTSAWKWGKKPKQAEGE
jgi:hypothetical protein